MTDFNKKELSSYLDGVPFTISQKFCPPRDIAVPHAVTYQLPAELLTNQYDFSLEGKVLAFCKAKEEAEERMKEEEGQRAAEQSTTSVNVDENSSGDGNHPANAMLNADFILQPKSQLLSSNSKIEEVKPIKAINLSDFEIDTRSPFDYIELQTINDLEELSTVFEGIRKDQNAESIAANDNVDPSLNNVSKSMSFPLVQNYNDSYPNGTVAMSSNAVVTTMPDSKSFSKNSDGYLSYSTPSMSATYKDNTTWTERSKRNSSYSDSSTVPAYSVLSQVPSAATFMGQTISHSNALEHSTTSTLRSSKSISDLCNLLPPSKDYSCSLRSHTPPAHIYNVPHREFDDAITFVKQLDDSNPKSCSSNASNGVAPKQSTMQDLLDPYDELSSGEKHVIDSITDMGFHRGQVSRTVKHLGMDEKQVVEHLCQIQSLEESGYNKLEAEAALHLHDYDKDEAVKYLDLITQFQDLGFERDAIKKALVQHKNDRDKVIDALLS